MTLSSLELFRWRCLEGLARTVDVRSQSTSGGGGIAIPKAYLRVDLRCCHARSPTSGRVCLFYFLDMNTMKPPGEVTNR